MQRSLFTGMTGFYGGTLARGVPEERPLGVRSFTNVDNPRKSFEDADNPANWLGRRRVLNPPLQSELAA